MIGFLPSVFTSFSSTFFSFHFYLLLHVLLLYLDIVFITPLATTIQHYNSLVDNPYENVQPSWADLTVTGHHFPALVRILESLSDPKKMQVFTFMKIKFL